MHECNKEKRNVVRWEQHNVAPSHSILQKAMKMFFQVTQKVPSNLFINSISLLDLKCQVK